MDLSSARLQQTVIDTWAAMFDLPLERLDQPIPHFQRQNFLTAVVQIAGEWVGAVTLDFSPELARRLTASTLECAPALVNIDQMRDVLGEVANVIGGNVKQVLPVNSVLSLPTLVFRLDYRMYMPDADPLQRVTFKCDGELLQATVFHVATSTAPPGTDVAKLLR